MPNPRQSSYNKAINWISPEQAAEADRLELVARRLLFGERPVEEVPAVEGGFDETRRQMEERGKR